MTNVADGFNRANGGLGANWISSPDISPAGHQLQISSNQVVGQVAGENEAAYWSDAVNLFQNDQSSQAAVGAQGGPLVRHQTGQSSYYLLLGDTTSNTVTLYRCDSGVLTQLVGWSGFNSGDVLQLAVSGSQLSASRNGTPYFGSANDTTYASGQAGIHVFSGFLDNWSAGPIIGVLAVATASGTGAATAVGRVVKNGVAAAAGIGVASGKGASTKRSVAAAAGQGAAAAAGVGVAITAIGIGAAHAVCAATAMSTAAAAGVGSARGVIFMSKVSTIHMRIWNPVIELRVG